MKNIGFPLRFQPAALIPAAALAGGFLALETALHGGHAAGAGSAAAIEELGALGAAQNWERLYRAAYAVYFAPLLVPALRCTPGMIRRVLLGFAALLSAGALGVALPAAWDIELVPCLLVASATFVLAVFARNQLVFPAALAFALTAITALATAATGRHDLLDLGLGAAAGFAACRLALSDQLRFLDTPEPWDAVGRRLRGFGSRVAGPGGAAPAVSPLPGARTPGGGASLTLSAVVLAAGRGSRLRAQGVAAPKPLVELGGLPLLERALRSARRAGAERLVAVVGCDAPRVLAELEPRVRDLDVRWVVSRDWADGNGASLLAAREHLEDGPFLVLMSDHVFLPGLLEGLAACAPPEDGAVMAVDRKDSLLADPSDATRVRLDGDLVADVRKGLQPYDAVDTGASLCTAGVFDALAALRRASPGPCGHSDAMRRLAGRGRLRAHDVGAARWEDVDDRRAFAAAETLLFQSLRKPTDGLVSRLLERRLSLVVTKRLCRTRVTPNQVTACVVGIGLLAAWLFSLPGQAAKQAGALVFWCASFLDGCDGELARLKFQASRLGGILDFWSDNVVHMAVFAAIGVGLSRDTGRWEWAALGAAASAGVMISAGWVYWTSVWPAGAYSSVAARAPESWRRAALARAADQLSRRDFIFWLNFIVLAGGLQYFLWAAAVGSHLFALVVIALGLSARPPAPSASARPGLSRILPVALGAGALVWLLWRLDASAVAARLSGVGWSAALAAPAALLWLIPNTLGLALALPRQPPPPSFRSLFAIRLAGEAVNAVLPSGYVGGEPLKAAALARTMPAAAATSSVAAAKAAQTAALLAFIAAGAWLAARTAPLPPTLLGAVAGVCVLLSAGVVALLFLPASGAASRLAGLRRRGGEPFWPALFRAAQSLETAQRALLRGHKARLAASTVLHFAGWTAGAVEIWLLAGALGSPLAPGHAFVFAGLATGVSVAGFFLPAMLGAFEAGHAMAAVAVGLPPETGLSIAVLRRAREALWIAVGLAVAGRLSLLSRPVERR